MGQNDHRRSDLTWTIRIYPLCFFVDCCIVTLFALRCVHLCRTVYRVSSKSELGWLEDR
jgi:hypothetical protein